MAIRFGNGFGIGASNNGGGGSLSFFTNMQTISTYLQGFMSEFRNPDFYEYALDGNNGLYINDGGGDDMYDDGNYTTPWLRSNVAYTGTSSNSSDYPYAVNYQNNGIGTIDTSFGYVSLGYSSPDLLPLTVIGTRATIASAGTPIGFQSGGNIGADGFGTFVEGNIYSGDIVSGFTVHSYYRETYDAGDPSVCDVFILLGHPDWNSVFGDVYYGGDSSNQGNGSYLYTTGGGTQNILAIKTLLSKPNGSGEVTFNEINTVVDNFIARIGETLSNAPTPTPSATSAPLTQPTPNGTDGPNGLITWLDYTTGINASNHLPDQSAFSNEFSYSGSNPYTNGVTGYTFTGSGSYASALSTTQFNQVVNSFTIEMWVKIPSIQGSMSLIAAGGNSSGGWALRVDGSGNQLNFVKYNIADQTVNLPYSLQSNTWYHIVMAQGGTSLTYMINGEIVGAVSNAVSNNIQFPNGTVNIAKDFYTTTNYAMSLGLLKIYDYCRLSSDIVTEFNNTKTGFGFVAPTGTPAPTATSTPNPTPTDTPAPTATATQALPTGTPGPTPTSTPVMSTLEIQVPNGTPYIRFDNVIYNSTTTISVVKDQLYEIYTANADGNFWYWSGTNVNLPASNAQYTYASVTGSTGTLQVNYHNQPTGTPSPTSAPTGTPVPTATSTPAPTGTPAPTATSTPAPSSTPSPTGTSTPMPTSTSAPNPTPTATTASTPMTVTIYESGSDVVMSASGTVDLSGLTLVQSNFGPIGGGGLGINTATFICGNNGSYASTYSGFTSVPSNFGSGTGGGNNSASGDLFGIIYQGAPPHLLLVPTGYTSGANISGTQTFTGTTLSTLGLTNGTYTYTWSGGSIDVVVGGTPGPTGTPSPTSSGAGTWYFYSDEGMMNAGPPSGDGNALFWNQTSGTETFNPNYTGGTFQIYFAPKDSTGTSYTSQFSGLTGGGTITISQNGDTATYTLTSGQATLGGPPGMQFFVMNINSSGIQTKTSNAPFVYADPISITFGS